MRIIAVAFVALGCGSKPPPPTGNVAPAETTSVTIAIPRPTGTCEPMAEPGVAGSHDRVAFEDSLTGLYGYRTKAGATAIAPTYKEASEFTPGGIAHVRLDNGSATPWRFIDPAGRILAAAFQFDNGADYFQEGFARIVDPAGKVGFIGLDGKILVAPDFDFAYPFCHGLAKTAKDGKAGYLDATGKPATGPASDDRPLIPPPSSG